jgi:hypothetical protein
VVENDDSGESLDGDRPVIDFSDLATPQSPEPHRFTIPSDASNTLDVPPVISVSVDIPALVKLSRQMPLSLFCRMMMAGGEATAFVQGLYGTTGWPETRAALERDPGFREMRELQLKYFLGNIDAIMEQAFALAAEATTLRAAGEILDPSARGNFRSDMFEGWLESGLDNLTDLVKRLLENHEPELPGHEPEPAV